MDEFDGPFKLVTSKTEDRWWWINQLIRMTNIMIPRNIWYVLQQKDNDPSGLIRVWIGSEVSGKPDWEIFTTVIIWFLSFCIYQAQLICLYWYLYHICLSVSSCLSHHDCLGSFVSKDLSRQICLNICMFVFRLKSAFFSRFLSQW